MPDRDVWAEILRLRERTHGHSAEITAALLRVQNAERRLDVMEPTMNQLAEDKKIRAAIRADHRLRLTLLQKAGACIVGASAVGAFVLALMGAH